MDEIATLDRPRAQAGDVVLLRVDRGAELLPAIIRREIEEGFIVVPLSADVHHAGEWDLLLSSELLGYEAVAQVWNFGSVLEEQVYELLTQLADAQREQLDLLSIAIRDGVPPPEGLRVGPQVLGDMDPRLLAHDEAAEVAQSFWEPALALAGVGTLGQLVTHRRRALDLDPTDLETVAHAAGWLSELEEDRLDIPRAIRPAELAGLLQRLRLRASNRLGRIALWTIEGQTPQLARRASGQAQAGDVERYVAEMLSELEED